MKYRIKLRKALLGRETTLGWRLSLEETIDEATRRLDWKAATRARIVDENGREIWRGVADGERRRRLWLWGEAVVTAVGLVGLIVVGLVEGI